MKHQRVGWMVPGGGSEGGWSHVSSSMLVPLALFGISCLVDESVQSLLLSLCCLPLRVCLYLSLLFFKPFFIYLFYMFLFF